MWDGDDALQATSCGTPAFMAPEVWKGNVNPHSDQYSLAATYFTLRVGRLLFAGNLNAIFEHLEQEPDLNPLPDDEQRALRKALAKEPGQRYANCREFIQALTQAVLPGGAGRPLTVQEAESADGAAASWQSLPTGSSKPTPQLGEPAVQPPARRGHRLEVMLGAIALMIVAGALVGFAAWYVGSSHVPPDTGPAVTDAHVPPSNSRRGINGEEQPPREAPGPEYVLKHILADVRSLPEADRPYMRYFSLDHLRAANVPEAVLAEHRDALAETLAYLSQGRDDVVLREIEPTHTVFRVDLRPLGWDQPRFQKIRDCKLMDPKEVKVGPKRVNLFDLALLEYPYATIDKDSKPFADVDKEFLKQAGQVRPIAYVRADWFVSVATQPPLVEDFLLHKPANRLVHQDLLTPVSERFAKDVDFAVACAELGLPRSEELKGKFAALADPQLASLAARGKVSRQTWEDGFGRVVRRLGLGTPILPLDGLTHRNFQLEAPLAVRLRTNHPDDIFVPGDKLTLFVHNEAGTELYIEVIYTDVSTREKGAKAIVAEEQTRVPTRVEAGQKFRHPSKGEGDPIGEEVGTEAFTLFASETPFPAGELLKGEGVTDRVVHPFYQAPAVDPARIVKITSEIETRRKRD
jgi:hypothetical protein